MLERCRDRRRGGDLDLERETERMEGDRESGRRPLRAGGAARGTGERERLNTLLIGERDRERERARARGERDLLMDLDGERESKRLRVCGDEDLDAGLRSLFGLDMGAALGGEGGSILRSLDGGGTGPLG